MSSLALVVLGGGLASFLRTTMLNRAQDNIAARLRSKVFGVLLTDRDMEFFQSGSGATEATAADGSDGEKGEENGNAAMDVDDGGAKAAAAGGNDEKKKKASDASVAATTSTSTSTTISPGAIGSILNDDIAKVSESLTTTLANTIRSTCSVTFATGNMILLNPNLLGLSVSVVPLIGTAAVVLNKFVKKVSARQREMLTQASSFAEERLSNVGTVKMSCREVDEINRYAELQDEATRLGRAVSLARGTFMGFMFAASSGALFMVFHSGGKAVAAGRMTNGELTGFATYTFLLGLGTSGIMKASSELVQGLVCAERVYGLMDGCKTGSTEGDESEDEEKEEREDRKAKESATACGTTSKVDPAGVSSLILDDVTFAYRSDPSRTVLKSISLTLQRGKVVALVGKNGSGKSTLANLLSALYRPTSGTVTVSGGSGGTNDVDLYSLDRKAQSSLVQAVPQHPALFDMSILDNVTYANPDATESEISAALTAANCDGFISKLEGGVQYNVGRNGTKLSGGQRQRVALARALLCDPCLLVLDEPTSSLDAEGETAVTDAVTACREDEAVTGVAAQRQGGKARGLLLITHRAKTLELADVIVVLKDGMIVERGPYEELRGREDSELCGLMPDLM